MLPLFILFTSAESRGVDLADGRTLTLSQALIAEPHVKTSGSEPWRVLGMAFLFFVMHVRVGTCYCRQPDAA